MQAFNIVSYLIVLVWMYATVYSGESANEKTVRFVPSEHQDSRRGVWAGDTCVVRLTAVSKTYAIERRREGVPALRDVSVDVRSGQVLSVLGTGGAGSSTLLRIIAGLDPDYRGEVERDVGGGRRDVGYCPERIVLFPYMSAMEHALLFQNLIRQQRPKLRVQRRDRVGGVAVMGKLAAKAEIKSLLSRFGLWQVRRKPVSVLSCGIQRRLQIALAVLGDPTLVVLDQPVAHCDKETREAVRAEVLRLGGQGAVVMSTRCLEDAEVLGGTVLQLRDGKSVYRGPVEGYGDSSEIMAPVLAFSTTNNDVAMVAAKWLGPNYCSRICQPVSLLDSSPPLRNVTSSSSQEGLTPALEVSPESVTEGSPDSSSAPLLDGVSSSGGPNILTDDDASVGIAMQEARSAPITVNEFITEKQWTVTAQGLGALRGAMLEIEELERAEGRPLEMKLLPAYHQRAQAILWGRNESLETMATYYIPPLYKAQAPGEDQSNIDSIGDVEVGRNRGDEDGTSLPGPTGGKGTDGAGDVFGWLGALLQARFALLRSAPLHHLVALFVAPLVVVCAIAMACRQAPRPPLEFSIDSIGDMGDVLGVNCGVSQLLTTGTLGEISGINLLWQGVSYGSSIDHCSRTIEDLLESTTSTTTSFSSLLMPPTADMKSASEESATVLREGGRQAEGPRKAALTLHSRQSSFVQSTVRWFPSNGDVELAKEKIIGHRETVCSDPGRVGVSEPGDLLWTLGNAVCINGLEFEVRNESNVHDRYGEFAHAETPARSLAVHTRVSLSSDISILVNTSYRHLAPLLLKELVPLLLRGEGEDAQPLIYSLVTWPIVTDEQIDTANIGRGYVGVTALLVFLLLLPSLCIGASSALNTAGLRTQLRLAGASRATFWFVNWITNCILILIALGVVTCALLLENYSIATYLFCTGRNLTLFLIGSVLYASSISACNQCIHLNSKDKTFATIAEIVLSLLGGLLAVAVQMPFLRRSPLMDAFVDLWLFVSPPFAYSTLVLGEWIVIGR